VRYYHIGRFYVRWNPSSVIMGSQIVSNTDYQEIAV
jgi:hypothetical protein